MNLKKYGKFTAGTLLVTFFILSCPTCLNDYNSNPDVYKTNEKVAGNLDSGRPSGGD